MCKGSNLGHSSVMRFRAPSPAITSVLASMALSALPGTANGSSPAPDLMVRLAEYAGRFESIRTHCSYDVSGRLVTFDRKGTEDSVKEMAGRIQAKGEHVEVTVAKYTEDGKDKTDEARKRAREHASEPDKKRIRMPILAEEQPRYVFQQLEADTADPARVRIGFVPKVPDHDTIEGSVWVDTRTATPLSAGFKVSKTPVFVDYMHFQLQFGAPTALGPAVSTVVVDGNGGVLFFRKRFHVTATLSDYRISP